MGGSGPEEKERHKQEVISPLWKSCYERNYVKSSSSLQDLGRVRPTAYSNMVFLSLSRP